MAIVTTSASAQTARVLFGAPRTDAGAPDFATRLRRARLGIVVALTAVVMIFVSYSSAYVVRKGLPSLDIHTGTLVKDWLPLQLPRFLFINTLVLLVSTLTMELARRQSLREATSGLAGAPDASDSSHGGAERLPWLAVTVILGLSFLAGQLLVWRELAAHGFYLATSASSSFFYLLTAMHGAHLLGGILALLAAGLAYLLRRAAQSRAVVVDATAWYWHFMTFLWIYLLGLLVFVH
jgi:cytochrome c oxidase subunit 3